MILNKSGSNTMICRCYDAATTGTPTYRLKIFVVPTDVLQTINLTDTSNNKDAYQSFTISGASITVAPGTYRYTIIDSADSNRVLEQGRITIRDTNHTLTTHDLTEYTTAHAVETPN